MALLIIVIVLVVASIVVYGLFRLYPPFGGTTPMAKKLTSKNFSGRTFVNQTPASMSFSLGDIRALAQGYFGSGHGKHPSRKVPSVDFSFNTSIQPLITWLGHSAFLLQLDGKTILLDPMLSKRASPFQWIGPKRFDGTLSVTVDDLPSLDAVLISHDHYDHLDYYSIKALAHKTKRFFVPLGLAGHLHRWGVPLEHITEMDWWDEVKLGTLRFACTPSRHFSGRTLTDRDATLWCSWVIESKHANVFFSGDGGYGPHFAEIGKKYGVFDLALLECGQYDTLWPYVHMMPEQTVQAARDLKSKRVIPIHWATFALAFHSWTDPIERALVAGKKLGVSIITPRIGQTISVNSSRPSRDRWWTDES